MTAVRRRTQVTWRQASLYTYEKNAVVVFSDDLTHDDRRWVSIVNGWGYKDIDAAITLWLSDGKLPSSEEYDEILAEQADMTAAAWTHMFTSRLTNTYTVADGDDEADPF